MSVEESFDADGTYLGLSVISREKAINIWGGANVSGDLYVNGDLNIEEPMEIIGDIHVDGDLHIRADVNVSGSLTVCGAMFVWEGAAKVRIEKGLYIGKDLSVSRGASLTSCGRTAAGNVAVVGEAEAGDTFIVFGALMIRNGGRMVIGEQGKVKMMRGKRLPKGRLIVDAGGSLSVTGMLDVSDLIPAQLSNSGGIWAYGSRGTVNIYHDVFVTVNGDDRSRGDLVQHGSDIALRLDQTGKLTSVAVTVNGNELDPGKYSFDADSVMIFGSAIDGVAGDVEINATSDEERIRIVSEHTEDMSWTPMAAATLLSTALFSAADNRCERGPL